MQAGARPRHVRPMAWVNRDSTYAADLARLRVSHLCQLGEHSGQQFVHSEWRGLRRQVEIGISVFWGVAECVGKGKKSKTAIYHPPKSGMPFLVVTISPEGVTVSNGMRVKR